MHDIAASAAVAAAAADVNNAALFARAILKEADNESERRHTAHDAVLC